MSYTAFGLMDRPLNPSGLPSVRKRYSAVGMERELGDIDKVVSAFLRGRDNLLAVVVGPYGWGKTELLDAAQELIEGKGIKVIRLSLSIGLDFNIMSKIIEAKRGNEYLVVMLDEADELTRLVSISGGINDEVKKLVISIGTIIRAVLEPRNYAHQLGLNPEDLSGIMMIAAFTPHLYYNILKNNLPDVFDITRGRVYREIVIDDRFPYWLYEAVIINRFSAYSTPNREELRQSWGGDEFWPLRREFLSFLYLAVKSEEGDTVTPRNMIKLTAKLLDKTIEIGKPLDASIFASFLAEEVNWINLDLLRELLDTYRDLSLLLLSGVPIPLDSLRVSPQSLSVSGMVQEALVIPIDPADSHAVSEVNRMRMMFGMMPIAFKDLRDLSIEYGSYYSSFKGNRVRLSVVLPLDAEEEIKRLGLQYIKTAMLKADIHRSIFRRKEGAVLSDVEPIMRELAHDGITAILRHMVRLMSGSAQLSAQSNIALNVSEQALDARLGYVGIEWDPAMEKLISETILKGEIRLNQSPRAIDGLILVVVSQSMLTKELDESLRRIVSRLQWKGIYPVDKHVLVLPMGSDQIDEARQLIMGLAIMGKPNPPNEYRIFIEKARSFLDKVNSFREELRSELLRYTIGIRRRESKRESIRHIIEQWISGDARDLPDSFKCGEKPCVSIVERVVLDYLNKMERPVTQRELESIIASILPVQLWREFREGDLIQLMRMRGLLIQVNERIQPISSQSFRAGIDDLCRRLDDLSKSYGEERAIIEEGNWKIQVKLPGSGEFMRRISKLRDDCKVLGASMKPSEDELKKYASILLSVDDLEEEMEESRRTLNSELENAKLLLGACSGVLSNLRTELERYSSLVPPSVMDVLKSKAEELTSIIDESISKLSDASLDDALKALESLESNSREEASRILEMAKSVSSIYSLLQNYNSTLSSIESLSKLVEDWSPTVDEIDMDEVVSDLTRLVEMGDINQLNTVYSDLSAKARQVRGFLMTGIEKARDMVAKYDNAAKWLEAKAIARTQMLMLNQVDQDLADQLERIIKAKTEIDAKLKEVAIKVNVPPQLIRFIAFKGPNVGIDEIEAGKALGLESQQVINYLEVLWRAKLVEKKYVS